MIVDTSVILALITDEFEAPAFKAALQTSPANSMSAANYVEAGIVIDRRSNAAASRTLDAVLSQMRLEIRPVTTSQARLARQAYREYGRGSGHPARLNFGDCFAYALAIETDEPLLFKGDDFGHTDVRVALTE